MYYYYKMYNFFINYLYYIWTAYINILENIDIILYLIIFI